ncbi:MAG: zinc-binding dehydrogenase [Ardenticatenaceae bacterium]|nr:zinc-binding dehydrogenase [Ardenticatenaceae bacterium]
MKYKKVLVRQRGGPEKLEIVEQELRAPLGNEAQIRVLATPVCQDDVAVRVGNRPFLKKTPFTPGYTCIGTVEAVGAEVTAVAVGDRVAALTNYDSHAEVLYWDAAELMPVPETVDPVAAVTLILNYLVAYQILHRVAQVKANDKVLIVGASGGVGTAFLQLGQLAGLKMYGLASSSKQHILNQYGAIPIDYRTQDFVQLLQQAEPDGIDFVFNGMGEEYFGRALAVLRRGGMLVHYGGPQSFGRFLLLVGKLLLGNLLPTGKKIVGYGTHRLGTDLFKKDWATLFDLLAAGKIKPVIAKTLPFSEVIEANRLLENGRITGNLVLTFSENHE